MTRSTGSKLQDYLVLIVAAVLALTTGLWAIFWPETYAPSSLLSFPRVLRYHQHLELYNAMVEPGAPIVVRFADAIRTLEKNPDRRALLLSGVEWQVTYRFDSEVWNTCFHPTSPTELEMVRRTNGWPSLRGDCKAKAILVASVARNLGIEYRFRTAPLHMWTEVRMNDGWRSINALGKQAADVRAIDQMDWTNSHSQTEFDEIRHRIQTDPTVSHAFALVCENPKDADALNPKRDPEVRFSKKNTEVIPGIAAMCMAGLILLPYHFYQRRRDRRSGPPNLH